jgi:hypothetical protein
MHTQVLPRRTVTGPALSRAFLSADDAARYAHERVGKRRDRRYASCIFKRDDGRFVASEPVAVAEEELAISLLFPLDEHTSEAIFPKQHTLHSLFYSNVALSKFDPTKAAPEWLWVDAEISLLMFSVAELRFLIDQNLPGYLSGAENSLILFSHDPVGVAPLVKQLGNAPDPGPLALELQAGTIKPSVLVARAAAAGNLEVLLSNGNHRWRPRGKVHGQLPIVIPSWNRVVPERVSFGAVFASADEAAQDLYLRDTTPHDEQTWFGFILKQKGKEQYVASELVAVDKDQFRLFTLKSLFPASRIAGGYRLPESFTVHSYFYTRPRFRPAPGASKNWLAEHFIVPEDLYVAVYDARKKPQVESGAPLTTYIAPMDGALIKYTPRRDTRLFDIDSPLLELGEIQRNLASGAVTTTDFVRTVAHSGELRVLRTNVYWDRKGAVDRYWFPCRNLQRLALGAVCLTADDAALQARQSIPSGADRSYGGVILKRSDGLFVATAPIAVYEEDFPIDVIFPDAAVAQGLFPEGCTIIGRYRSRVARDLPFALEKVEMQVYLNMLSVDVLRTAFSWESERLEEYLFCPDGAVVRYRVNAGDKLAVSLFVKLGMANLAGMSFDKIKQHLRSGQLSAKTWVARLLVFGTLQVVKGSKLWGAPGTLSAFVPFPFAHASPAIVDQPACSPVFIQAADAARFAHEQTVDKDGLHVGVLLKDERNDQYSASLPQAVHDHRLTLEAILPNGAAPARHAVHGLHLRAPALPATLDDHDYRHFFSPLDISRALSAVYSPQGYLPIYLSCADGALLRYQMSPFDADAPRDKFGQSPLLPNRFGSMARAQYFSQQITNGSFELGQYIRQFARAGELNVLIPSTFWSRQGVVGKDWLPRMRDLSQDEHWANYPHLPLGPMFHHADDAARYVQQRAGSGYVRHAAYESAILGKPGITAYVPLEPLPETDEMLSFERIFRTRKDAVGTPRNKSPGYPNGYALMAAHQLYVSGNTTITVDPEQVYANYASPAMVYAHTFALKDKGLEIKAHYYSTPHGALVKYVPYYSEAERRVLTTKTADYVDQKWVTRLSPGAFITQLANAAELRVLKAAHYWNQAGRLGTDWRTSRQEVPASSHKPSRDEL